ncbi:MAG TPA: matrixin family metalloprotease [Candidatus Nanoarchaeia archaeon]|nr:matrixin family metalloprotease [Candidatus Nanoarchaeia archaeon]
MGKGSVLKKLVISSVGLIIVIAIIFIFILIPAYVHYGANNIPGYYNALILSKYSPYSTVVIEVDYQTGMEPDPKTIEILQKQIEQYSEKPVVIHLNHEIENDEVPLIINGSKLHDVAMGLQKAHRNYRTGWLGGNITIYVMYLDTTWHPDNSDSNNMPATDKIYSAGVTYLADSIIIFKGSFIKDDLETTILLHEFGHIFGLDHSNESDNMMNAQFNVFHNIPGETIKSQFPTDFSRQDKEKLARLHRTLHIIPPF